MASTELNWWLPHVAGDNIGVKMEVWNTTGCRHFQATQVTSSFLVQRVRRERGARGVRTAARACTPPAVTLCRGSAPAAPAGGATGATSSATLSGAWQRNFGWIFRAIFLFLFCRFGNSKHLWKKRGNLPFLSFYYQPYSDQWCRTTQNVRLRFSKKSWFRSCKFKQ